MPDWVPWTYTGYWIADAGPYLAPWWPVLAPRTGDAPNVRGATVQFIVQAPPPGGDLTLVGDYTTRPSSSAYIQDFGDGTWHYGNDGNINADYPYPTTAPPGAHLYVIYSYTESGPGFAFESCVPAGATATGRGQPWITSYAGGWVFSPDTQGMGLIGDAGLYQWRWPVWPPAPQNLDPLTGEIDYLVSVPNPDGNPDGALGDASDNYEWDGVGAYSWSWCYGPADGTVGTPDNTSTGYTSVRIIDDGWDPAVQPPGCHLFVMWMDRDYRMFGNIPPPPKPPAGYAPYDAVPGGGGWSRALGGPSESMPGEIFTGMGRPTNLFGVAAAQRELRDSWYTDNPSAMPAIGGAALTQDTLDLANSTVIDTDTGTGTGTSVRRIRHADAPYGRGLPSGGVIITAEKATTNAPTTSNPDQAWLDMYANGYAIRFDDSQGASGPNDFAHQDNRRVPDTVAEADRVPYPNSPDGSSVYSEPGWVNTFVGWYDYDGAAFLVFETSTYRIDGDTNTQIPVSDLVDSFPFDIAILPDWFDMTLPGTPGGFGILVGLPVETTPGLWEALFAQPADSTLTAPLLGPSPPFYPYVYGETPLPLHSRIGDSRHWFWLGFASSWTTGRVPLPAALTDEIIPPDVPPPVFGATNYRGWRVNALVSLGYGGFTPGPPVAYQGASFRYWIPGPYLQPAGGDRLRLSQRDDSLGIDHAPARLAQTRTRNTARIGGANTYT